MKANMLTHIALENESFWTACYYAYKRTATIVFQQVIPQMMFMFERHWAISAVIIPYSIVHQLVAIAFFEIKTKT
jgi:hypothetical protein